MCDFSTAQCRYSLYSFSSSCLDVTRTTQDGNTALICAADQGHAVCVRQLVDAKADKDAKTAKVMVDVFPQYLFHVK
jgi:hypothetical protein